MWTIIGLSAGFICISGFVPQIFKAYRTKKLDDLSYLFPALTALGMSLWVLYGFFAKSFPIIFTNFIGIICNIILIIMKFIYSKKGHEPQI